MPTVDVNQLNYGLIVPELVVLGLIFLTWVLDLMLPAGRKAAIGWVTVVGLVVAIATAVPLWGVRDDFAVVLRIDEFSTFFKLLFLGTAIGITLISIEYADRFLFQPGEFYGLVLCGTLGMIFMAEANELLTAYIALELLSFSSYVLVSYAKTNLKSNEAGMKYIILGAFSSALLLYGISLLYGTLGTTYFPDIARNVERLGVVSPAFGVGLALIMAGLGFKVAAVPFHMWTPDVYQGAPTPVTGFMAAAAKAAGFAALLRIFFSTFGDNRLDWQPIVWVLAVLSLVVGSVLAVVQTDVKRMLAYSSIAHAGYILIGLQAANSRGIAGSLFYLLAYTFMILGSFGIATLVGRRGDDRHTLDDYRGLARSRPGLAFVFTVFLLAQAGVPLTSGFLAKFYVIAAAVEANSYALAIIAMVAAVIAAFFYLRLIVMMYMADGEGEEGEAGAPAPAPRVAIPLGAGAALGLALIFTVAVGILPEAVLDFARHATVLRL
jgi:NADH-quinone oxidoreductase subunit N